MPLPGMKILSDRLVRLFGSDVLVCSFFAFTGNECVSLMSRTESRLKNLRFFSRELRGGILVFLASERATPPKTEGISRFGNLNGVFATGHDVIP